MTYNDSVQSRNRSIQILRVVSCLMVFSVHFGQRVGLGGMARKLTDVGARGVQLFFLISGFLAAFSFAGKKSVDVKQYYIKRAIAILPLYYLVILYYFLTENFLNQYYNVIPADELGIGWSRYLFLLNGILNSETYFWSNLGITWTIPVFAFFYLLAPWLLTKVKGIWSAVFLWGGVFFLCKGISSFYPCTIVNNLHYLFFGAVLFWCTSAHVSQLAIAVLAAAAVLFLAIGKNMMTYVCLFSCMLLAMLQISDWKLPNWMQSVVDILDRYSYTLYLMHGVVFCSVVDRLPYIGASRSVIALIAVAGTFLATWIVGTYIEKPIQSVLRKHLLD